MKRGIHRALVHTGLLVGLFLIGLAAPARPGFAISEENEIIRFADLDISEQQLRGPFDAMTFDFRLPSTWQLRGTATLQLDYTLFFAGMAGEQVEGLDGMPGTPATTERQFGGTLEVLLNNVSQQTLLLDQMGEQTTTITFTTEALSLPQENEPHVLRLVLDTDEPCGTEQFTNLVIRSSSRLYLPHRTILPSTDLTRLPFPLSQRSFSPDAATLVIPDEPADSDLQAALAIAAGFGRMTGNDFALDLTTMQDVRDEQRDETHLIFVGQAAAFPLLEDLELPAPFNGSAFVYPDASDDDGIVQMIVSPWNETKVLLIASGNSDTAVVKAAQAISHGKLITGQTANLALVADVQPEIASSFSGIDRTFGDLGYQLQQMRGLGGQYAVYNFDIPPGQQLDGEAYVDLVFVHSSLLDYEQSGLMVSLNNEPIASVRLDDSSTRLGRTRLALPETALRPGTNILTIRADLLPRGFCIDPRSSGLWMTIRPESLLHLPLRPADMETDEPINQANLNTYPLPFTIHSNLSDLAFVLADNLASWQTAARLAFDLGQHMQGGIVDFQTSLGDRVPEPMRAEHSLIVVGHSDALPLLDELENDLPAPFEADDDLASAPNAPIVFRATDDVSIGYIQLLAAPWDAEQTILVVTGSTDEGLEWAGNALTTPELRVELSGNLAVITNEQIDSSDTRISEADAEAPVPTVEEVAEHEESPLSRVNILLLVAVAGSGLVVLIIFIVLLIWLRQRSIRKRRLTEVEVKE